MFNSDNIQDTENHFKIDSFTRKILNDFPGNNILVQYDHNSERFTFDMPRYVDGHDMSKVTEVRIHYCNTSTTNQLKSKGIYVPTDLEVVEGDENIITFSWLISSANTRYVGALHFSIQFVCLSESSAIEYSWNTGVYKDVVIIETINNADSFDV